MDLRETLNLKVSKYGSLRIFMEVLYCLHQIQSAVFNRRHFFQVLINSYFYHASEKVVSLVYFFKIDSATNHHKYNGLKQHLLFSQSFDRSEAQQDMIRFCA